MKASRGMGNPGIARVRKWFVVSAFGVAVIGMSALAPGGVVAQVQPASQAVELRAARARLDFLLGDWRVEQFTPIEAGDWRSNGEGELRFISTMNDLYLETNARSGRYVYHIVFSFDAAQQQYRVTSRDDQSGLIDVYEGVFDEQGALVVSNVGPGTHYAIGGVRYHNRMSFAPTSGGWVWLVEVSGDGGQSWRPQVRVSARR